MKEIVIVGGGAAGCMAAIAAAQSGARVTILEKNALVGKKLAITGKGRCNLTNASPVSDFIKKVPGNGNFLYSALHRFGPEAAMDLFRQWGVELEIERGRRVFPLSDDAHEVVNALKKKLKELGVNIKYNAAADGLSFHENRVAGVWAGGQFHPAAAVIVATGGLSYPLTGSTGDGYALAREAGHSIVLPRPALVPLETAKDPWVKEVSGLTLKNVAVTALQAQEVAAKGFGEMLFTHFGLSGPVILTMSRAIGAALLSGPVRIVINLKPALKEEQLKERLQRDFVKFSKKIFANSLTELLPASLISPIVEMSGISRNKPVSQINKEERQRLQELLTNLTLTVTGTRPIDEAIITAGGVNVKEIDPKTMASRLLSGLYFAGEVLDVDADTGGYNLQIAWSTGFMAGVAAAEQII